VKFKNNKQARGRQEEPHLLVTLGH